MASSQPSGKPKFTATAAAGRAQIPKADKPIALKMLLPEADG
jgi:hypothetical protein